MRPILWCRKTRRGKEMLSDFELSLLDLAFTHFSTLESLLRLHIIRERGWGFEHWFQNELLVAWPSAYIRGKMKRDSDILVNENTGVELKCWLKKYPTKRNLINALKQHPGADLYLFLMEHDEQQEKHLREYFNQNDILFEQRGLDDDFSLILARKRA